MDNHLQIAWSINNRITMELIDAIGDAALDARPIAKRQGRNVAEVFIHLHNVRLAWAEHNGKKYVTGLKKLDKKDKHTAKSLKAALISSGEAIEAILTEASEGKIKIKGFKQGAGAMLGYMISHDAHHRGQIMIALKQSGIKLPEKKASMSLWSKWW